MRAGWVGVVGAWTMLASGLSGCIDYFAEPPTLPPRPADAEADRVPEARDAAASRTPDAARSRCVASPERCNGRDDDCDRRVDESPEVTCPIPARNAASAESVCVAGACVLACNPGQHDVDGDYDNGCEYLCAPFDAPETDAREACNGRDDDCDGEVDEAADLEPPLAPERPGICAGAAMVCIDGDWQEPSPEALPRGESDEARCDALDNDCDGAVDEGLTGCDCALDAGEIRCEQGCDEIDDDGDGRSDEGCPYFVACGPGQPQLDAVPPCNGCPEGTAVPVGWVCIPAGEFVMGSPAEEVGRENDEGPRRTVQISRPFLMTATEVTQAEWRAMFDSIPAGSDPCPECPVTWINWFEAVEYAERRSAILEVWDPRAIPCYERVGCGGVPGEGLVCDAVDRVAGCHGFRLPTEAEWEYAARAGTSTRFWTGDAEESLEGAAWHLENSGPMIRPAGGLQANRWGLVGVHGNAAEFVEDWYGLYRPAPPGQPLVDPVGEGDNRCNGVDGRNCSVVRGGAYFSSPNQLRVADREVIRPFERFPVVGFRLVLTLP